MRTLRALALLTVLNLAVAAVLWWWKPFVSHTDETQLPFGTQLAAESAVIRTSGDEKTYYLLLFVNNDVVSKYRARIAYALSLSKKFADAPIATVVVATSAVPSLTATPTGVRTYIDRGGALHKAAHIAPRHSHGGFVVLSADGRVQFRTTVVPPEDEYRQISEKLATGVIDYRTVTSDAHEVFAIGLPMPVLREQPLTEAAKRRPAAAPHAIVVLLMGRCSSCELREYESDLMALNNRLLARDQADRLSLVFDSSFDESSIRGFLTSLGGVRNAYRADIRALVSNGLDTRVADLAKPLVVTLNGTSGIVSTSALRVF